VRKNFRRDQTSMVPPLVRFSVLYSKIVRA
jgi:hypothetical protein